MQARMLGQAIAVAAHSPASIELLDEIDAEFGVGGVRRDTGVAVESWSAGGCHIFTGALCSWINRRKDKVASMANPMIYTANKRMVHVITFWRGWLFDDRGAWSRDEFLDIYSKFHGKLIPYVASKYATANVPRRPGYVKSLEAILDESLLSPDEWIPDAKGIAPCGRAIIYDRVTRLMDEPRYVNTKPRYVPVTRCGQKR
jgi:hypothetical protein